MRRAAFVAAVFIAAMASCASAGIKWIERDYDFGLMKEIAGPKTGTSRFVNTGSDTISIFSVRPSCGCTTADYSDTPLAPGDTAVVSYTYNPKMRPGKFDKSVKVRLSNGERHSIRITGNVIGTPESLASIYPIDAGDIRLSDASIHAGDVTYGRTRAFFVNAYSLPLDTIFPTAVSGSEGLVVTPSRKKAGPGDIITFSLNFDSRRHGMYGPVDIPVTFRADHGSEPVTLHFHAFVLPDTEVLRLQQKDKNPSCDLSPDPIDLGMNVGTDKIMTEFRITNGGSGPLHILRLHTPSEAVRFGTTPKEIKTGKTAVIKLEIDPGALPNGPFRIPIDIISDDPAHPHLRLPISGNK